MRRAISQILASYERKCTNILSREKLHRVLLIFHARRTLMSLSTRCDENYQFCFETALFRLFVLLIRFHIIFCCLLGASRQIGSYRYTSIILSNYAIQSAVSKKIVKDKFIANQPTLINTLKSLLS